MSFSVWLISFSIVPSGSVHVVENTRLHSFYGWIIFHCIYIYINIFFIHSYVDKHLNCFYKLAIINNDPMICGYISFLISAFISFGYTTRSEISGSRSSAFLVFWGISHCFLRWLHQFAYPIVHRDSILFPSLSTLVISCPFYNGHFNKCELSYCGYDFNFPND